MRGTAGQETRPELGRELQEFLRERIARYKVQRSIDFSDDLPRTPTGKLQKHKLRERYLTRWPEASSPRPPRSQGQQPGG